MRKPTRKQAATVSTDRCDYVVDAVGWWGYEVTVKAKYEGHHPEDSFTSRPFKKLADAIEMIATHERKLTHDASVFTRTR